MIPQKVAPDLAHPDAKTIQSLFSAISAQYDFLNSFLSFGLERFWRRRLVSEVRAQLPSLETGSILDLGVGTGKSLDAFLKATPFRRAVGCDFSERMLGVAKGRLNGSCDLIAAGDDMVHVAAEIDSDADVIDEQIFECDE